MPPIFFIPFTANLHWDALSIFRQKQKWQVRKTRKKNVYKNDGLIKCCLVQVGSERVEQSAFSLVVEKEKYRTEEIYVFSSDQFLVHAVTAFDCRKLFLCIDGRRFQRKDVFLLLAV